MAARGRLEGRIALVTGAARGQGRSHCLAMAREGADIVACDLDQQIASVPYPLADAADLAETVRLVEELDRRCLGVVADVRDSSQVDAAFERALSEFGKLDIAVANHGLWAAAPLAEMSDDQWNDVLDTMATGTFFTVRAAANAMIPNGYGRIICTSSTAGRQGMPNFGNYAAAKWAIIGLVKSAALELGQYNITANCVCPGTTKTDMIYENEATYRLFVPDKENPTTADVEAVILRDLHKMPVPWIDPSDISNAVCFLASEEARYVSGIGIDVNCGLSGAWTA
jgi:SDR family mycofactocin-dependent oxidoreductase